MYNVWGLQYKIFFASFQMKDRRKKSGFTSWEGLVLFTVSAVCYLSRVWYEQVSEERKHGISKMEDPEIAIPYLHLLRPTNTTQQQWTSSLGEWLQSAFYSPQLDSSTVCNATNTPVLCASCKKSPRDKCGWILILSPLHLCWFEKYTRYAHFKYFSTKLIEVCKAHFFGDQRTRQERWLAQSSVQFAALYSVARISSIEFAI